MYGDEFVKIKAALDGYMNASNARDDLQKKRRILGDRRKEKTAIKIAFVGVTGEIDVPAAITNELYEWLDTRMAALQGELATYQVSLTCPAGTCER